jgi:putative transposase
MWSRHLWRGNVRITRIRPDKSDHLPARCPRPPLAMFTARPPRLSGHDYRQPGWYFVTVTTAGRRSLLGRLSPNGVIVSRIGEHCCAAWTSTLESRPWVSADAWCVMPDHIHFLVGWDVVPAGYHGALSDLVTQVKAMTTRSARFHGNLRPWESLWASGYWDCVIRNGRRRAAVRQYIEANPRRAWERLHPTQDGSR